MNCLEINNVKRGNNIVVGKVKKGLSCLVLAVHCLEINNVMVGRVKKGKTIIFHLQVAVVESSLNAHQHHCHRYLRIIQSQVDK